VGVRQVPRLPFLSAAGGYDSDCYILFISRGRDHCSVLIPEVIDREG
jgi:hypothetical protein